MRRSSVDQGMATIIAATITAFVSIICTCIALVPQLNAKDTDISEAKKEIAELKAQISEMQRESEMSSSKGNSATEDAISSLEERVHELEATNSNLKAENDALVLENESLKHSVASVSQSSIAHSQENSAPAVMLTDLDYFAGSESIETQSSDQDNFGDVHTNCIVGGAWSRKYALNGQYTRMTGTLYQSYQNRSKYIWAGTSFEVFGDGRPLYAKLFSEDTTGYRPEDFKIDLVGVQELEVKQTYRSISTGQCNIAIGDCGLWK